MKSKLSPFLIGSFVIGGLMLIVVGLLSFRSLHLFSKPGRFVAYFNDSVQGLDIGSPVKLRGVRMGRVITIEVHYDSKANQSQVAVTAEFDRNAITDRSGAVIQLSDRTTLQQLIDEGLRAKIDLAGITGLQFVELNFFDPLEFPAPKQNGVTKYPVVPTLRSGMSELVANLSKIAINLNKVDYAGLGHELQSLLATINHQVGGVDLKQMVASVTAAAASIGAFVGTTEARQTLANLNKTAVDVQGFVAKLDAQIEPVQAQFIQAMHSFHEAAASVQKVLGPQSGITEETVRTLQHITEMAESMQRLAEYLERNPSALFTGKKHPDKEP